MITFLTIVHVIVSLLLILLVLLQFGKGAEAGLIFNTEASSILPQSGNLLTKVTSVLAALFLAISLILSIMHSNRVSQSVLDDSAPVAAPLDPSANAPEETGTTDAAGDMKSDLDAEVEPAATPSAAAPTADAEKAEKVEPGTNSAESTATPKK